MLKPEKEQANWFVDHLLLVYNCCTTCPRETTAKFKIPSGMETGKTTRLEEPDQFSKPKFNLKL